MGALVVKDAFSIDETNTHLSQRLHLNGGSILNVTTNIIYEKQKQEVLEVPFLINYIIYDIRLNNIKCSRYDYIEEEYQKLLYIVNKNQTEIINIVDCFTGEIWVPGNMEIITPIDDIENRLKNIEGNIFKGSNEPVSPYVDKSDLWMDTTNNTLKIYKEEAPNTFVWKDIAFNDDLLNINGGYF